MQDLEGDERAGRVIERAIHRGHTAIVEAPVDGEPVTKERSGGVEGAMREPGAGQAADAVAGAVAKAEAVARAAVQAAGVTKMGWLPIDLL